MSPMGYLGMTVTLTGIAISILKRNAKPGTSTLVAGTSNHLCKPTKDKAHCNNKVVKPKPARPTTAGFPIFLSIFKIFIK